MDREKNKMYFSKLHCAFNNLRTSFKWLVGFPGGSNSKEVKWSEVKVAQLCPTLCDPMGCSPWNSPGQNTGVGSLSFFQRIFLTQESNQDLLQCRRILYLLSYQINAPWTQSVHHPLPNPACPLSILTNWAPSPHPISDQAWLASS